MFFHFSLKHSKKKYNLSSKYIVLPSSPQDKKLRHVILFCYTLLSQKIPKQLIEFSYDFFFIYLGLFYFLFFFCFSFFHTFCIIFKWCYGKRKSSFTDENYFYMLYIRILRVSNGIKDNNENDWWKRFNMIYVLKR